MLKQKEHKKKHDFIVFKVLFYWTVQMNMVSLSYKFISFDWTWLVTISFYLIELG